MRTVMIFFFFSCSEFYLDNISIDASMISACSNTEALFCSQTDLIIQSEAMLLYQPSNIFFYVLTIYYIVKQR